jgi:hypothetical protein
MRLQLVNKINLMATYLYFNPYRLNMMNHILIPASVPCLTCRQCGARPVIALVEKGEYVVKCPYDESHYQTSPGLIDIEDWNRNNLPIPTVDFNHITTIAC